MAYAGTLSSSASRSLPGLSLRDLLHLQYIEASLRIERFDLHASAIDHMTNARDGDRRFTDVGRDDHFANIYIGGHGHMRRWSRDRLTFWYLSKDEHLLDVGHVGVERQDDNWVIRNHHRDHWRSCSSIIDEVSDGWPKRRMQSER